MKRTLRPIAWLLRKAEGLLYGPLWLDGSDWCGDKADAIERWIKGEDAPTHQDWLEYRHHMLGRTSGIIDAARGEPPHAGSAANDGGERE